MSIKNTFISLLTLLLPIYAAGDGKMTFRQTGFADGLPHSDINDIVQDGQGYMWFATYGGLCKWDGYRMTVMTSGNSDLPRERVLCLCAASDSLLYIGTESGGLCIYDDRAGKFLEVDYDSPSSDDVVNCIFESRDGSIFVCHNNILSKIVWKDSAAAVKTVFKVPYSSTPITAAIDLEPDVILIGCGHSLYLIDSRNGNVSTFDDPGYIRYGDPLHHPEIRKHVRIRGDRQQRRHLGRDKRQRTIQTGQPELQGPQPFHQFSANVRAAHFIRNQHTV